ncbi:vacuolar fusion protein CCZ1-like protein isoform X2 [Iris pallida]|uniref:Vacuolar fusion protein CCZ1-like protein isoform X2 n=1 Tax=Iris pallida TaxID=29817 RepID=A0AAX6E166_IRIPA|nr:vacuolar fusion protein CCZ1-like protein isoform X2 [Iris pallida]
MGLSSTAASTMEGFQFCIFDLRRGQQEGQELDKILFFSPSDCPYSAQLSVIGLSEGIITFTRIFSPEAACEVIEAEKHTHVFYEAEPDIWMVMVLEKNKDTESIWRCDPLQETLKEIHSLFVMFHGTLRGLLEKQPSGELVRSHLFSFVTDYINEFHVGKRIQMPSFCECLRERGTVQMLTISREVAIEIQSLITVLGSSGGNIVCNSLILFQDLLVSTTLSPDDTANIFTYAVMRLTPRALSSTISSWSYLKRAKSAPNVAAISSIPTSAVEESHYTSCDTSPGGQRQRFHIPRPLQRHKWSKGKDGFVIPDIWDSESGNSISLSPTVWFQETEERMCLCVYQHKSLTIILLVPVSLLANGGQTLALLKKQLVENASQKVVNVEEKLSRGWGGENAYHVAGYRYLLIDDDRRISRASPPGKVTTLTKESLLALNRLREEVDLEKAIGKRDNPEHEEDLEVCIRARNNAWVIAKVVRGRELYMVLEKANETLLYASDALEKFSNRYCDGAFSA